MTASNSWKEASVGQRATLLNGFAFSSKGFTDNGGMPLIRIRDLRSQTTEVNYRGRFDNKYVVRRGDLLIGMDGDFDAVKWTGSNALLNQRVCKLETRNPDDLVQDFLFYRIIGEVIRINRITAATTVKHLSSGDVLGIRFELPPEPEQSKIAEILSTVDRAIEQTEGLIAKQQRIKTGLMQDLLTRGIDEQGNLRSEQTHQFKDSPLGRIPVEWEVHTIDELLTQRVLCGVQDGNHGEKHPKSCDFVAEGIPFIMASDIADGFIDVGRAKKITEKQYLGLRIGFAQPRDVLLSHKASIGFVALVSDSLPRLMLTPQVTYYRVSDFSTLLPEYLTHFFQSGPFQDTLKGLAKQSTRDYIGILAQRKLHITFPDRIKEQEELSKILSSHSEKQEALLANKEKLYSLKTALMQDLLTGEVRVTPLLEKEDCGLANKAVCGHELNGGNYGQS